MNVFYVFIFKVSQENIANKKEFTNLFLIKKNIFQVLLNIVKKKKNYKNQTEILYILIYIQRRRRMNFLISISSILISSISIIH